MDLGLSGKKAILAGATSGMGKATALQLAQEGCHVSICGRGEDALETTLQELSKYDVTSIGKSVDMTDDTSYRKWIESSAEALGGCDIFIPFASARGGPPSEENWKNCFELDILSLHRGIETVMPYLEKSECGSVVSIASSAATEEWFGPQPFSAMKAATINFTSNYAQTAAANGIRMNCVSPGPVDFEGGIWQQVKEQMPEAYDYGVQASPFKRMGTPEEVAKAIVFVASPACPFMTGANILIDGGVTKRVQY